MGFMDRNLNDIESLRDAYKTFDISTENKYQIFKYGDAFYSTLNVLKRFKNTILTHVISIYLQNNDKYLPPLFLVVEGTAGEGKTSQSIASCIQHGITVIYISASQLSGSHEHDAIDVMESVYKKAIDMRRQGDKVAIIVDDFHLSNASVDANVKKTINSSLLTGYLMNLTQNKEEEKIPIILTGNDFSQVYSPLIRAGRADRFEWSPNYDEKKYIVENIFRDYLKCSSVEFERFFARCSKASIADFSQLINDYRKSMVSSCFDNIDIIDDAIINNISRFVETRKEKIDYKLLIQFAKERHMLGD